MKKRVPQKTIRPFGTQYAVMADEHNFYHCFKLQSMLIYAKICRVYYLNQKIVSFSF